MFSHSVMFDSFAISRTIAYQAPLSMGFLRQEYWNGLPFPSSGDLPNPGIKSVSRKSPTLVGKFLTTRATWEAPQYLHISEHPLI